MRGFVFENECDDGDNNGGDAADPRQAMRERVRREFVGKLAAEWNAHHARLERRSWRSREERDAEAEYIGEHVIDAGDRAVDVACRANPNLSSEEEARIRKDAEEACVEAWEKKDREEAMRLDVIEELLGGLGARMMRPYEHWNEEEKIVEYLETRYDDDYDDY